MNNEDKKRKCAGCLRKFPKYEMVIKSGTYRCEACWQESNKIPAYFFILWGILIGVIVLWIVAEIKERRNDE